MEHGRTGRRFRFLIPAQGTSGLGTALLNVLFGAVLLGALGWLGVSALDATRELTSASSPLHRLDRPVTEEERSLGRVRGTGTFRGLQALAVCYVEHQYYVSGKNGGWRTDQRFRVAENAELAMNGEVSSVDPQALRFDPEDFALDFEEHFRSRVPDIDAGGRVRHQCALAGEPVFVEACVDPALRRLAVCADGTGMTITQGDGTPRRRIRSHANDVAAGLSAGVLVLALLALYLWKVVRAGALVGALLAWNPAPKPSDRARAGVIVAILGLPLFAWGTVAVRSFHSSAVGNPFLAGYGAGATVIAAALIVAFMMWDRRKKLTLAMEPVIAAETMRLARVGSGPAELAVRVPRDAPTVSIPDHAPRAFVCVEIKQVIPQGRSVQVVPLRKASWPSQIPVEDPTGRGVLDLTHAELDTRASFRTVTGDAARTLLTHYASTPFGRTGLESAAGNLTLQVEESYVDPGETLYLLGHIQRIEDPQASSTYREMGTTPVVGGSPTERLVLYAGSERSLLSDLSRERVFLSVAAPMLAIVSAVMSVALVYLRARA